MWWDVFLNNKFIVYFVYFCRWRSWEGHTFGHFCGLHKCMTPYYVFSKVMECLEKSKPRMNIKHSKANQIQKTNE